MICVTCANYEPEYRHCALLDIWDIVDEPEVEDPEECCEYHEPDPSLN